MNLKDKISNDLKASLKKGDRPLANALRLLQAAIKNREIERRPEPLREEDILGAIKKQAKISQESLEGYKKAGYERQAAEEARSLSAIQAYLPKAMPESELKSLIQEVISELKAESLKDMGRVMQEALARSKGRAGGRELSALVRERLQKP